MSKITFKTRSGAIIQGTIEEVLRVAAALGETVDISKLSGVDSLPGYYNSSSKGLIPISSMTESHIKMALLKRVREYYDDLKKDAASISNLEFKSRFVNLANDKVIQELYKSLK